jgi:hypothetical protein
VPERGHCHITFVTRAATHEIVMRSAASRVSHGKALVKSCTKPKAFGLPKPVVKSNPVVVAIPAIPEPKTVASYSFYS